ncbi:transcription initiation factor IIB [Haloarcula pelagica]|uniref:transcription initiation factor IIB n=1 Tax=Haloarcula pelagica TaxID=3033389 RepID=UPI0024C367F3|nr:transcription initiation factor IIB family protein [Halomicroarcula sp. YJ-61-S]
MSSRVQTRLDASTQICPECGASLATSGQETHCPECGLVVDEQPVDHGPEWRSFDDECKGQRTGAPRTVLRHDRGLSTTIGAVDRPDISASRRRRLSRQRRLHSQSKFESKRDRNLAHGLGEIRRMASALEQSHAVRERAATLFQQSQDANLLHGRSIEGGAAAAVYAAGRCNGVVRMRDVAEVARCSEGQAWNCYRTFQAELELSIPVALPVDWVPKVCSDVPRRVPRDVQQHASQLAEQATESAQINGNPVGIATAAVYLASRNADQRITQETLSEAVDLSTTTIRLWFGRLQTHILD